MHVAEPNFLHGCLGSKFRSLCLILKHCVDWAIFAFPPPAGFYSIYSQLIAKFQHELQRGRTMWSYRRTHLDYPGSPLFSIFHQSSRGTGEMAWLRALVPLVEDQGSVPSPCIGKLTMAWDSNSRGSDTFFWLPWSLYSSAHIHNHTLYITKK